MKHLNAFASIFAALGALLGLIFGPADGLLITLIVFAVLDYITGIGSAVINKTLSSQVGFVGIAKKLLIFAIVAVGNLIDVYILGGNAVLRSAVIFFYLANEGLSILENVGECGLPFPRRLKNILAQLRKKSEEDAGGAHCGGAHCGGAHCGGAHCGGEHCGGEHCGGEHCGGEHCGGEHCGGEHCGGEGDRQHLGGAGNNDESV